jgi:hypothetical protein
MRIRYENNIEWILGEWVLNVECGWKYLTVVFSGEK